MLLRAEGLCQGAGAAPATLTTGAMATVEHPGPGTDPWPGFNHTLAANDNKVLAFITFVDADALEGVTYGGVAMVPVLQVTSSNRRVSVFYLDDAALPAAGTITVVVNPLGTVTGHAAVVALKNAAQGLPASNSATVTAAVTASAAVTVAAGGAAFKATCIDGLRLAGVAEGAGETVIYEDEVDNPTIDLTHQSSYKLNQSGAVAMATSWTGAADAAQVTIGVNPI